MNTFALAIKQLNATISRSGAVVARWAHNPKVVSSSLASATKQKASEHFQMLFLYPHFFQIRVFKSRISIVERICNKSRI